MAKQLNFDDFVSKDTSVEEVTDITQRTPRSIAYKKLRFAFIASYINTVFGILSIIVACYAQQTSLEKLLPKWIVESEVALFILLAILVIDLIVIFVCSGKHAFNVIAHIYGIALILPSVTCVLGFIFLTPVIFMMLLGAPTIFVLLVFWSKTKEIKDTWLSTETNENVKNLDHIRQ